MQTVSVDGVTYTKASAVAKKFRYTQDYIGQLCRNEKADCQLVGRSWYVSEASLLKHKDARYKPARTDEKTFKTSVVEPISAKVVMPRLTRKAAKHTKSYSVPVHTFPNQVAKYYADEAEVLPLLKTPIRPIIPIIPELSEPEEPTASETIMQKTKNIKVRVPEPSVIDLEFTPVPELALQGNIKVESYDSMSELTETTVDLIESEELIIAPPSHARTPVITSTRPVTTSSIVKTSTSDTRTKTHVTSFVPVSVARRPVSLALVLFVAISSSVLFSTFLVASAQEILVQGSYVSASVVFALGEVLSLMTF